MHLERKSLDPEFPQNMLIEIATSTDVTWCHQKAGIYNLKIDGRGCQIQKY